MFTRKVNKAFLKKLIPFVIIAFTACSSPKSYLVQKSGSDQILIGSVQKNILQKHPSTLWFEPNYKAYQPDSNTINELKKLVPHIQVLVFAGTWCTDTQRELPKFYKVADAIGLNQSQIEVHMLNENKKGFYLNPSVFNVGAVPTFIFLKHGKEIGRIIEMSTMPFELEWLGLYKTKP